MTVKAGIVCGKCDQLNQVDSHECSSCKAKLSLRLEADDLIDNSNDKNKLQQVAKDEKEEEPMEQARSRFKNQASRISNDSRVIKAYVLNASLR